MASTETPPKKKGISFGEVRVREHERILNPRASSLYAGLELGWSHRSSLRYQVDDFEKKKEIDHNTTSKQKKKQGFERLQALAKYGYNPKDVVSLEQQKKTHLELREKGIEVPDLKVVEDENCHQKKKGGVKGLFSKFVGSKKSDGYGIKVVVAPKADTIA